MTKSKNSLPGPEGGEIVLYSVPGGDVRVECLLRDETIWLTQKAMEEIVDPRHEMHEDAIEWFEDGFDSDAFDLDEVHAALDDWRRDRDAK